MRSVCGLLVATTLVIGGCNRAEAPAEAPATPAAPAAKAYAPLARMMQGIAFPASNIIFDTQTTDPGKTKEASDPSGGATQQFSGVYGGWMAVENAALALQETANLLMIPGRNCENGKPVPIHEATYRKAAEGLAEAGRAAYTAAQTKNLDAMVEVSGTVSDACAMCHEKYRDTPKQPTDRCMP